MWNRICCGGVTVAQGHVLLELRDIGETSLNTLADALALDKSTTSKTVDALVKLGLVDRAVDAADRRYVLLTLSPAGMESVVEIDDMGDSNALQIFREIPRERRGDIVECLRLLVEAGDCVEAGPCDAKVKRTTKKETRP
jgi:MarR family 2-MHQ and catechol resistance regulon transcriptional repressor